jgi:hypothetical protein
VDLPSSQHFTFVHESIPEGLTTACSAAIVCSSYDQCLLGPWWTARFTFNSHPIGVSGYEQQNLLASAAEVITPKILSAPPSTLRQPPRTCRVMRFQKSGHTGVLLANSRNHPTFLRAVAAAQCRCELCCSSIWLECFTRFKLPSQHTVVRQCHEI